MNIFNMINLSKKLIISIISVLVLIIIISIILLVLLFSNKSEAIETNIDESSISEEDEDIIDITNIAIKPDGKPLKLKIDKTEEETVNDSLDSSTTVDNLYISDFILRIPAKLKEVGYEVILKENNTFLKITSSDGNYVCKIARYSGIAPYVLTDVQKQELNDIYNEQAAIACETLGIPVDAENYYEIFNEEHSKIDSSNPQVLDFYARYGLNKYERFSSFTHDELFHACSLLNINFSGYGFVSDNNYNNISKSVYQSNADTLYFIEIGGNTSPFNGIFVQNQTVNNGADLRDYEVTFKTK